MPQGPGPGASTSRNPFTSAGNNFFFFKVTSNIDSSRAASTPLASVGFHPFEPVTSLFASAWLRGQTSPWRDRKTPGPNRSTVRRRINPPWLAHPSPQRGPLRSMPRRRLITAGAVTGWSKRWHTDPSITMGLFFRAPAESCL